MMFRQVMILLSGLLAVAMPSYVFALGLGQINLKSHLNQPLNAEIELLQVRDLTASEILASLANIEDFKAAGIERTFFLTSINMQVVKDEEAGRDYILLTTQAPVREPFLNMLVEILWPSGRLLREYTLLVDPPMLVEDQAKSVAPPQPTAQNAQPKSAPPPVSIPQPKQATSTLPTTTTLPTVAKTSAQKAGSSVGNQKSTQEWPEPAPKASETKQPAVAGWPAPAASQKPSSSSWPAPAPSSSQSSKPVSSLPVVPLSSATNQQVESAKPEPLSTPVANTTPSVADRIKEEGAYRTQTDDNLWLIADMAREDDTVSVQQMMLAIQEANPDAFIDGNINLLKKNELLSFPDAETTRNISQDQAIDRVREQNRQWRARVAQTQGLKKSSINVGGEPEKDRFKSANKPGTGKIVLDSSSGISDRDTGEADSTDLTLASADISELKNERDRLAKGKEQAEQEASELQSQIDESQKIINLQSQNLAEALERLKKLEADNAKLKQQLEAAAVPSPPTSDSALQVQPAPEKAGDLRAIPSNGIEKKTELPSQSDPLPVNEQSDEAEKTLQAQQELVLQKQQQEQEEQALARQRQEEAIREKLRQDQLNQQDSQPVHTDDKESFVGKLFANPIYLVVLGAIIALLVLLGVIFWRSRREEYEEFDLDDIDEPDDVSDETVLLDDVHPPEEDELDDDMLDALESTESSFEEDQGVVSAIQEEASDILGEADIYLAYGRFEDAIKVLVAAIEKDHHQPEFYLKLLEVYAEQQNTTGFLDIEQKLIAQNFSADFSLRVDRLKKKLQPSDALDQMPTASTQSQMSDLDKLEAEMMQPSSAEFTEEEDVFESVDQLVEQESIDEESLDQASLAEAADLALSDFELDLSDISQETPTSSVEADTSADLDGLDLNLDTALLEASLDDSVASSDIEEPPKLVDALGDSSVPDTSVPDSIVPQLEPEGMSESDVLSPNLVESELSAELPSESSSESLERSPTLSDELLSIPDEMNEDTLDSDIFAGTDEASTKLDLARAYLDMGDRDGAREILGEVMAEGNDQQIEQAKTLLESAT